MCSFRRRQASQAFVLRKQTRSACARSNIRQNVGFCRYKKSTIGRFLANGDVTRDDSQQRVFLRNTALQCWNHVVTI